MLFLLSIIIHFSFLLNLYPKVLRFIKLMWRNDEKIVAFRTQKLERRLLEKGKSPLPAERVRQSIKEYNIGSCENI